MRTYFSSRCPGASEAFITINIIVNFAPIQSDRNMHFCDRRQAVEWEHPATHVYTANGALIWPFVCKITLAAVSFAAVRKSQIASM